MGVGAERVTIVFFWTGVSATMAACWRELAARPGVRLVVFLELARRPDTAYADAEVLAGIDCRLRYADEPLDAAALDRELAALKPDAAVVLGWRSRMCRTAAEGAALADVPKFFAFDMPFAWSLRKVLAPFVLRRYLRRFVGAIVPGERSAVYARHLGFAESRIERGLIGLDTAAFAGAARERATAAYPRRFLYVGRYAPEKRIDVLVAAYRRYRADVADPWELTCCGMGSEAGLLAGVEGIRDRGFVQPAAMPGILAEHGAFVLASAYDPWPFVIAEAVAAGLPVVCTSACGNTVELVRSWFNGRIVGPGDVAGFADALRWIHDRKADLPWLGRRGMPLAAPYAKEVWADRMLSMCGRP
jgi:glycosyltransferase involved in cell wall biosynthesis